MDIHELEPDFSARDCAHLVARRADRAIYAGAQEYVGLPEGVSHWELLTLAEDLGPAIGLSPVCLRYLSRCLRYTQPQDWEHGQEPIVFLSVNALAEVLNVSARQVQNIEAALHKAGVLLWRSSGNHRRFGRRNRQGYIEYGYGVSFAPMTQLYSKWLALREAKRQDALDRKQEGRRISSLRRCISQAMQDAVTAQCDLPETLCAQLHEAMKRVGGRALLGWDLHALRSARRQLELLLEQAQACLCKKPPKPADNAPEISDRAEENFRQYNTQNTSSNNSVICKHAENMRPASNEADLKISKSANADNGSRKKEPDREFLTEQALSTSGIEHVTLDQVQTIITEEFRFHWQTNDSQMTWQSLGFAAQSYAGYLGINQSAWQAACGVIGANAAALAVIIADRRMRDPDNPVRSAGGFLRALIAKAPTGELHLHKSVFGLMAKVVQEGAKT
ncbi:plasmid replication protein RepC [Polycladidibacter hongkongensis]|uniref:plasmid replication protein RepC n=1 Tax=Polycladidibacter hongkongensis TaxID=1647556 RepID=UPI000836C723|nr:plasmid replication protein RepC [Pseudovibrio hongkongensis]